MNKKLTLSLDEATIEKARDYAHKNKKSLSKLVEKYFQFITSDLGVEKQEYPPIVKELMGSIKVPEDFDYDKARQSSCVKC